MQLHTELNNGTWQPGPSICFVVTHPKPREVWAADFRDRIVHHLLYNQIGQRIERTFIADSCACIEGRGTLYAAQLTDVIEAFYREHLAGCNPNHIRASAWIAIPNNVTLDEAQAARIYDAAGAWPTAAAA